MEPVRQDGGALRITARNPDRQKKRAKRFAHSPRDGTRVACGLFTVQMEATMGDVDYYRAQAKFWAKMASSFKRPDYQDRWLRLLRNGATLPSKAIVKGTSTDPTRLPDHQRLRF
jgi:hypothetical protein